MGVRPRGPRWLADVRNEVRGGLQASARRFRMAVDVCEGVWSGLSTPASWSEVVSDVCAQRGGMGTFAGWSEVVGLRTFARRIRRGAADVGAPQGGSSLPLLTAAPPKSVLAPRCSAVRGRGVPEPLVYRGAPPRRLGGRDERTESRGLAGSSVDRPSRKRATPLVR